MQQVEFTLTRDHIALCDLLKLTGVADRLRRVPRTSPQRWRSSALTN